MVDRACLENKKPARAQGFESPSLLQIFRKQAFSSPIIARTGSPDAERKRSDRFSDLLGSAVKLRSFVVTVRERFC